MAFTFSIRILKKHLENEKTIAARGADRFATGRVKELTDAIDVLSRSTPKPQPASDTWRATRSRRPINLSLLFNR